MKNKIFTILLSLLMVLSTTNIIFAEVEYPFTVTYHFKYHTSATEWAEKTWSQKVSGNSGSASKVINKIIGDNVPPKYTDDGKEYYFAKKWKGQGETKDSTERVYIYNKDYTEATDIYYEAVYNKVPVATVHAKYLNLQAEEIESTISQNMSPGVSWTVKVGAFDDDISKYKHFEYHGKEYTFTGWDPKLPLTIKGITEDTDYYFTAQYNKVDIKKFKAIYTDKVANGSGSWSNLDENDYPSSFDPYKHEFKKPADIPAHYTFLYWEKDNKQWKAGDIFTQNYEDLDSDKEVKFIATYEYQPPVVINYYYDNKKTPYTVTNYEDVNIYDAAPKQLKWFYEGENEPISEDEIATIPDSYIVQEKKDDKKVINVYAKYFTINWLDDNGKTLDTSEMVPYGEVPEYKGETPTKEATPQYTYKFLGWTPDVIPAKEDKAYMAVYNEITNIYTITFVDYDGTVLSQADYPYGTPAAEIEKPIPNRQNTIKYTYIFAGWDPEVQDVTEDATYTAVWEEKENPPKPTDDDEPEELDDDPDDPKKPEEKTKKKTTNDSEVTPAPPTFGGWIPTNESDATEEEDDFEPEDIFEGGTPKGFNHTKKYWALINLICVILSAIFALISLFIKRKKYEDEDLQKKEKRKKIILKIIGIILFICGIVLFILTEDMTATMILIDKWTLLNVLLFINNLLAFFILIDSKKDNEEDEEEEDEEE